MAALREVIETRGAFCSLYSDRAGHFFVTAKRGERIDPSRPTQVGRALQDLGIRMIPAYSPQARGRSERNFGTWAGTLAARTQVARHHRYRQSQRISSPAVHQRVQCSVLRTSLTEGQRLCKAPPQRPGLDLQRATRTDRE